MTRSSPPASLPSPYFLGQDAMSVAKNATFRRLDPYFQPFLTEEGAERFFEAVAGKVDGLDFLVWQAAYAPNR